MSAQVQSDCLERDDPGHESRNRLSENNYRTQPNPPQIRHPLDVNNDLLSRHLAWFAAYGWR